jgi:hypothetical protein
LPSALVGSDRLSVMGSLLNLEVLLRLTQRSA